MFRRFVMSCSIISALLLLITGSTYALSFTDNFDDQAFTVNNWQIVSNTWSFTTIDGSTTPIDYGFRGEYTDDNAIAIADNSNLFNYLNLSISTELSIQNRLIYESGTTPKDEGGTIAFADFVGGESIFASLFYSHDTNEWIHGAGIGTNDGDQIERSISGIEYDRFFYLDLAVDGNGIITSNLFDDTGALISTIVESNGSILSNGIVGIVSDADTTFNNFSAAAPVPEPATMLLLGTGLVGLAGAGRKKIFKK